MDKMGEKAFLSLLLMIISGVGHVSRAEVTPDLHLKEKDPCKGSAVFEWKLKDFQVHNYKNCTVDYGPSEKFLAGTMTHKAYLNMSSTGIFTLNGMNPNEEYSVQIRCGSATSEVVRAKIYKDDCGAPVDDDETVIEYKQPPSLLGGRDSMLGIVFGLLGFLIILITSIIVWKKYRHWRRREQIRRYLGSSQVDPFENLQHRMDNHEIGGTGSERLMGSSDSLT